MGLPYAAWQLNHPLFTLKWIWIAVARYSLFWLCLFYKQRKEAMDKSNVWLPPDPCVSPGDGTLHVFLLLIPLCVWFYSLMCVYFCTLTAIWGELQPQLFILELLQENNDWLLVDTGLPFAGHQQDTHHMLLYPSNQFCCPNGSCGCQGRPALFPFLVLNGPIYPKNALIHLGLKSIPLVDKKSKYQIV